MSRDMLKERLAFNDNLLRQYDQRAVEIDFAYTKAEAALLAAQHELAGLAAARDDIQTHQSTLREENERLQASLASIPSRLLKTFPFDLLRYIMSHVAVETGSWTTDGRDQEYYMDRVRVPFVLASVCRRWRTVALDTSSLWTFIHSPKHDVAGTCVELLLERSGVATLSIAYIQYGDGIDPILETIAEESVRWRDFLWILDGPAPDVDVSFLRRPFPAVENFVIKAAGRGDHEWSPEYPQYLPFAPRLRYFSSSYGNIFLAGPREGPLPLSFIHCRLFGVPLLSVLESLQAAPQLEVLELYVGQPPADPTPLTPVFFPNLRVLRFFLYGEALSLAQLIRTNTLREVRIVASMAPVMADLFSACAATIQRISFPDGRVDVDMVPHLRSLRALERIVVSNKAVISDSFLDALTTDPELLPRLHIITVNDPASMDPPDSGALVRLIKARNSSNTSPIAPSRISKVTLTSGGIPNWLKAQVDHMLGDA